MVALLRRNAFLGMLWQSYVAQTMQGFQNSQPYSSISPLYIPDTHWRLFKIDRFFMPQPSLVALWSTVELGNLATFTGKEGEIRFLVCFSAVKISLCLPESAHSYCQAGCASDG